MDLYKEDGTTAGLYDVCEWWLHWYPDDIFINEPEPVIKAREQMNIILSNKR